MLISKVKQALPYIINTKVPAVLIGKHGIGKSQVIKQYTEEQGIGFIDLRLGTMSDAGDLIGLADFERDEKGNLVSTTFVKPSFLPTEGKGILFLDELNRAPNDLIQPIFQLVLDRKMDVNGYVLPEGWDIVCAMNPPTSDYTVTNFNDMAFNDRFCFLKVEEDFKGFMEYAKGRNFDPRIISYLTENEGHLGEEVEDFDISQFAKRSPRSWEFANRILAQEPSDEVLFPLLTGVLGLETASSFKSSLEREDKPITAQEVFNAPKKTAKRTDLDRSDKIKVTFNDVDEFISNNELKKKQVENLLAFLKIIQKDDCAAFLDDVAKKSRDSFSDGNFDLISEIIFNDEELLNLIFVDSKEEKGETNV